MPATVGREEVSRFLRAGGQVVEVLPADEYQAGHVAGAINIPLREIAARAGELDRSRPVVTYCNDFL